LIFLIERGVLIGNVDATLMDGEHRKSICAILRNAARYETPPAKIFVEIKPIFMRSLRKRSWIAYNESEHTVGFYTMMEHSLALPFVTEILGIKVALEQIDMNEDNAIVAVCGMTASGREFQFWIFRYHRQRQEELNGLQLIATGERSARERVSVL
jgi:hypothetical protein